MAVIESIVPHLRKCFEGIDKLQFQPDNEVRGMCSVEGATGVSSWRLAAPGKKRPRRALVVGWERWRSRSAAGPVWTGGGPRGKAFF